MKNDAEKSAEPAKTGTVEKIIQLKVVEEAICKCFREISGFEDPAITFDLDTHRIIMEYTDDAKKDADLHLMR